MALAHIRRRCEQPDTQESLYPRPHPHLHLHPHPHFTLDPNQHHHIVCKFPCLCKFDIIVRLCSLPLWHEASPMSAVVCLRLFELKDAIPYCVSGIAEPKCGSHQDNERSSNPIVASTTSPSARHQRLDDRHMHRTSTHTHRSQKLPVLLHPMMPPPDEDWMEMGMGMENMEMEMEMAVGTHSHSIRINV